MAAAATPALAALIESGVPHEVVKFAHDPRERLYGGEAVQALTSSGDVSPEQMYKTLIIAVPDAVSPFGQRTQLPTVIDAGALTFDRCTAVRAGAAGTSLWHPAIWSGSPARRQPTFRPEVWPASSARCRRTRRW